MLVAGLSETPRGSAAGVLGLLAGRLPEAGEVAGLLGDVLWVVTYVLIIRAGFRSREYGIPLTAIALNFTWELIYGVLYPPGAVAARVLHGAWLALDLVIVIQLVRYGKAVQTHSLIRRFFYPIVAVTLVLAFIGHLLFRRQFVKRWGAGIQRMGLRKLRMLDAAVRLEDLRVPPGNRLEKLVGARGGQYCVRVNDQWRICFVWREGDAHDVEMVDYH